MAYQDQNHPKDGYVFIVTYGRSGSTLLQNLLNGIDGYCIRGENNNALFHLAQSWQALVDAEPIQGVWKTGETTDMAHPWYGVEHISADGYGAALSDVFTRHILNLPEGTRVGGFKEIRFHSEPEHFESYLNFIHRFFPNARFVFNSRNHAAVARSGWWAELDPKKVSNTLESAEALYWAYIAKYPDRSIHLHYDSYVEDPRSLEQLFTFLGEPYDEALVQSVMNEKLEHLKNKATS